MKNTVHALLTALATAGALLAAAPATAQASPGATLVRTSSFEYDANGLLIREVVEPDRPDDCLQTNYTHDTHGNRTSASALACPGASGHALSSASAPRTSTTEYAARTHAIDGISYSVPAGTFPTRSTNALGHGETKEHDLRHGGVTRLTGPNGLSTTWAYDGFGRKTREQRADGTFTTWSYRLCQVQGQPRDPLCPASVGPHPVAWYVSEASFDVTGTALSPARHQFHDSLERAVRVQTLDFEGQVIVQDTHYNTLGQLSQKSVLHRLAGGQPHWTTYTYDALGRVRTETTPDGNGGQAQTHIAHSGLSTTVTNPLGQTQTTHKNASGQTARIVDHLGSEIRYTHDALGQLIQTEAAGAITRITYTRRGHKASMLDPAMGAWDYAYNAFGELVWQQDSLSQTSTMAYDALGRMIQRTEPDLVSRWYHDKRASGAGCGAGIGKLCEATADNGYRRVNTYDTLGRPVSTATALDSVTNPATVSLSYHSQSGRLASQTWPTGYRASYAYNAHGFLSSVTGGDGALHPVASMEIQAMDPQGRVQAYRQGGKITTLKNLDPYSGRLNFVRVTSNGMGAGRTLNHMYSYDKLGNLLTRNDLNTGVRESFQYDALNRLSLYTALGGGLPGVQTVQTLYDAMGNLRYKSDVGYYHYDPLGPRRLSHVTLSPGAHWSAMGAVTQPNTGTRALSYAFDDARSGARSFSTGVGLWSHGNGNLWYTVSQDQASGRHTVRWETYTSFNMPGEIHLGNLAAVPTSTPATVSHYTCPQGYLLNDIVCQRVESAPAATSYACPAGYSLQGNSCSRETSTLNATPASAQYICPTGYTLTGATCSKTHTTGANAYCKTPTSTYVAAANLCHYAFEATHPTCQAMANIHGVALVEFRYKNRVHSDNGYCVFSADASCPAGSTLSGTTCSQTLTEAATLSHSCPSGQTLNGANCESVHSTVETQPASPVYSCAPGAVLNGSTCQSSQTQSASPVYRCPGEKVLNGTTCSNPTAAVAERTLSFAYGPEHQRIRQTVALTSSAPSHMESGTTWYLNGTNSQGLTYEKEVKANGSTEHRHYLSAAGITFALYVKREGGLNGQSAASVRYFHHDHLGSIASITDENGVVVERLAYDPWGKRRNTNGESDLLDALHGVNTDRGYTMHEHLDEMGIVHMNGRLYDPLIARFMSADPFIQFPGNLQSHNRYAYVLNNPLAYTDPSGHFLEIAAYVFFGAEVAKQLGIIDKGVARAIQGIAAAFMTGQWATAMGYGKVAAGVMGGFAGGFVGSGGNIEAGIVGGLTGGMFGHIGAQFEAGTFGSYAGHAVVGCVSTVARGGGCSSGATSALFGKFTSHELIGGIGKDAGLGEVIAKGVATAAAGGLGSKITAGRFANGALTAAYGYLFNQVSRWMNPAKVCGPEMSCGGGAGGGGRMSGPATSKDVVTAERAVIGRVKDLQNLPTGEKSLLDRLPDKGNPRANWVQNSGVLRQEMNRGLPIRDASPGDGAGQFLNAERYLLKERGWTLDAKTNYWLPPNP